MRIARRFGDPAAGGDGGFQTAAGSGEILEPEAVDHRPDHGGVVREAGFVGVRPLPARHPEIKQTFLVRARR